MNQEVSDLLIDSFSFIFASSISLVKLLYSEVVKYFFKYLTFLHHFVFLTRSLTFGISFLKALRPEVVAKPVILRILPSISIMLLSQSVFFLICPLVSMELTCLTNSSCTVF